MIETSIQQWGNSLAVRLPKEIIRKMKLHAGSQVSVASNAQSIVIKPEARTPRKTLDELLKGMTAKNIHRETDWGPDVGKEIW